MKRVKRLISLALCVVLCLGLLTFPSRAEFTSGGISEQRMSEVYENYIWDGQKLDDNLFVETFYPYWVYGHNSKNDTVLSWLMAQGSRLIDQERNPEKYAEILSTLLVMQTLELSTAIESQSEFDNLKSGQDYVRDVIDVAGNALGASGLPLANDYSPVIEAITGGAENLVDQLGHANYFSATVQDYICSHVMLQAIIDYTDNEDLRTVAKAMQEGSVSLFQKRLDYLSDSAKSFGKYEAKFFLQEMMVPLLKETDGYQKIGFMQKAIDKLGSILGVILERIALGKAVFEVMMLIGNLSFGTSNSINRHQEFLTLSEIADSLKKANEQLSVPDANHLSDAYSSILRKSEIYKAILMVHARGAYMMYSLHENDAGLLSIVNHLVEQNKDPNETAAGIFEKECRSFQNYSGMIHDLFVTSEDGVEFNGHRYMLVERARVETWDQARQLCLNRRGHLATITSAEENQFLKDYILSLGRTAAYFGYSDAESEGHWRWENDEQSNYANWSEGEPNNDKNGEHYAMFYHADRTDRWNDGDFGVLSEGGRAFLCEWDTLPDLTHAAEPELTPTPEPMPVQQDSVQHIPGSAVEFNGHHYLYYDLEGMDLWEDAEAFCRSLGGHLATISSEDENSFLYDYITHLGHENAYFGFSDAESEGNWKWINGENVVYTNWHSGEPNAESSKENYAMFYYKFKDGTWNDGAFGQGKTVSDDTAFICEWDGAGSDPAPQTVPSTPVTSGERDVVLVLDMSGSMAGAPMDETKKAAVKFVQTVLPQNTRVGIVTFDSSAYLVSDFSGDERQLTEDIRSIDDGGSTNTEAGLSKAYSMLNASSANKKIIVLMSDGIPNEGREGEALIEYANSIKSDDVYIYALGFFNELSEGDKISAQALMEGIASDGCHYEVANADDLVYFFNDIADQINGQKYIYVRIACPVDVSVIYNGQVLDSSEDNLSLRTDFGTLTFEQNESNEENPAQDDRVKVLRLKEGVDYDVRIEGTGRGIMEYTIGFMDEGGKYSDFRTFRNVRITERTMIDTVAAASDESILNVDEDGDGKYDIRYSAEANGYGKEIKASKLPYILIGADALFAVILILIIMIRNHNNRKRKVNY